MKQSNPDSLSRSNHRRRNLSPWDGQSRTTFKKWNGSNRLEPSHFLAINHNISQTRTVKSTSTRAGLLVQNIQNFADLPLRWVSTSSNFSATGGFLTPHQGPPGPHWGLRPTDPHYRLALRARHVLSRPTFHFFPTPMLKASTVTQSAPINSQV